MSDLIDRQDALFALGTITMYKGSIPYDTAVERIKKLKPALSTNLASLGTDCISRQAAVDVVDFECGEWRGLAKTIINKLEALPAVQPERTCVNCGRTMNNGGWYADGRTRCPIEEHYALPKDGFCHLWEKRNVTDDDYPERRTDE